MKAFWVLLTGATAIGCLAPAAEVRIESLSRNSELTWTNSVSNATYRVEWAAALTGPWQQFSALTNLSSVSASNTTVTVTVPMFYRVVWTDPPTAQPVGNWGFNGYDGSGSLIVTGRLSVLPGSPTNSFAGYWSFGRVSGQTNYWPLICSSGQIGVWTLDNGVSMFLTGCHLAEGAFWLEGTMVGDAYSGTWYQEGFAVVPIGAFVARREGN